MSYLEFIKSLPFSPEAFLFDLDGVLLSSERIYQKYWEKVAKDYGKNPLTFPLEIQGVNIDDNVAVNFPSSSRDRVKQGFVELQLSMEYELFDGAIEILEACKKQYIKTAIVTSSDMGKMQVVYRQHPIFNNLIDVLITAEDILKRKPAPDCWLKAAVCLGVDIKRCIVFEDSAIGLQSALKSEAFVVGLTTTHKPEDVKPLCNYMINHLTDLYLS